MIVRHGQAQIKIEVNPVMRGCVFAPEWSAVSPAVEAAFGFAEMQVASFPDLYAGKLVAALDRQHPRDLFDVRDLLANEGIGEDLWRAFAVYLLCHSRPMHEVLNPARKQLAEEFARGFQGMTDTPVTLEELEEARESLIAAVSGRMPDLSFRSCGARPTGSCWACRKDGAFPLLPGAEGISTVCPPGGGKNWPRHWSPSYPGEKPVRRAEEELATRGVGNGASSVHRVDLFRGLPDVSAHPPLPLHNGAAPSGHSRPRNWGTWRR